MPVVDVFIGFVYGDERNLCEALGIETKKLKSFTGRNDCNGRSLFSMLKSNVYNLSGTLLKFLFVFGRCLFVNVECSIYVCNRPSFMIVT